MLINFDWIHIYIGLVLLGIALIFLWRKNKSVSYLFFFAIFWIYMMTVVSVVVFPFFIPENISEFSSKLNINLVPFDFGNCFDYLPDLCIRSIYENILLAIPFGLGINFIAHINPKKIVWLAVFVGLSFEITQLVMALILHNSFRTADINDVILNATGVLLGYGIFRVFGLIYSFVIQKLKRQPRYIFAYIYDVVRNQN
jgi:glycopeptide antibiotics resistance protein